MASSTPVCPDREQPGSGTMSSKTQGVQRVGPPTSLMLVEPMPVAANLSPVATTIDLSSYWDSPDADPGAAAPQQSASSTKDDVGSSAPRACGGADGAGAGGGLRRPGRKRHRSHAGSDRVAKLRQLAWMYAVAADANTVKFVELLDNWKWKNKLFKNTQYTGKLVLWAMDTYGLDKRYPLFRSRLRTTTKFLSLMRRWQVLLAWMEDLVDMREAYQRRDWLSFNLFAASFLTDICDDALTVAKTGIIDKKSLPSWVERSTEVFWGVSTVLAIIKAHKKYRRASAAAHAAKLRQKTGQNTSSQPVSAEGSESSRPGEPGADVGLQEYKAAKAKQTVALVSLIKYVADAGQSFPEALQLESYPEICDHLSGWLSGLLSTYKIWLQH